MPGLLIFENKKYIITSLLPRRLFMNHGFIRIGAATPQIKIADCKFNSESIVDMMRAAEAARCEILVLPELCLTGSSCGDLFFSPQLIDAAKSSLDWLVRETADMKLLTYLGLPYRYRNNLYNVVAAISGGKVLALTAKTILTPNEKRWFAPFDDGLNIVVDIHSFQIAGTPFNTQMVELVNGCVIGVEIGSEAYAPVSPAVNCVLNGATVIVNPSAENETYAKTDERRAFITQRSKQLICAYARSGAGDGESTTDYVFAGHNLIAEHGELLTESVPFENGLVYTEADVEYLLAERTRTGSFSEPHKRVDTVKCKAAYFDGGVNAGETAEALTFNGKNTNEITATLTNSGENANEITATLTSNGKKTVSYKTLTEGEKQINTLYRNYSPTPFLRNNETAGCGEILTMQAAGLMQRLRHTGVKDIVLALSGGLDSTLALLVAIRAFDRLSLPRTGICCVSMPCFGTSERTRGNAQKLAEALNCTFIEIPITEAVIQHFKDIGHDINVRDLVYENAQARERTQVAMDLAAKRGGFMLGTGDLSELALGFATYGGDHLSMYSVNASVPKTLIPHILLSAASDYPLQVRAILQDLIDTPISPELLPDDEATGGKQQTENIVGPYRLHDFFLYHFIKRHASAEKIQFLAGHAFKGEFTSDEISKWLDMFMRRFYANQFKRSCAPDGPGVMDISLSPRGGFVMGSDVAIHNS
jgi:NAD+ synthase (glutamine-hydrolysing)